MLEKTEKTFRKNLKRKEKRRKLTWRKPTVSDLHSRLGTLGTARPFLHMKPKEIALTAFRSLCLLESWGKKSGFQEERVFLFFFTVTSSRSVSFFRMYIKRVYQTCIIRVLSKCTFRTFSASGRTQGKRNKNSLMPWISFRKASHSNF